VSLTRNRISISSFNDRASTVVSSADESSASPMTSASAVPILASVSVASSVASPPTATASPASWSMTVV